MKWQPDCVPCVLRMAMNVARSVLDDDEQVMDLLHEVMRSPHFTGSPAAIGGGAEAPDPARDNAVLACRRAAGPPRAPEVVRDVWARLTEITGEADMLREEKARQNAAVLAVYQDLRAHVRAQADPFVSALRLAVTGNVLDMMVETGSEAAAGPTSFAALVRASEEAVVDGAAVEAFRARVSRAEAIVYIGDNCGEVVLDRLFIETVRWSRGEAPQVAFVTRALPSGNDVTPVEAEAVGMGEVARILPNGIPVPLPGTDLSLCSAEVRRSVDDADLVISKGGANFELLDDEEMVAGRITFLLHGKCRPLCGATGVGQGHLVVANR